MRIEIECCGCRPRAIHIITDAEATLSRCGNRIVIESSNERISHFTIKSRSVYNSKLCYLNIINPIYYLYQYKSKNDDVYFYDNGFLWADIDVDNSLHSDLKITLEKCSKSTNDLRYTEYTIKPSEKRLNISFLRMPLKQIHRYKVTNIASQLLYSMLILCLGILALLRNQDNIALYSCALIILLIVSIVKVYKYLSSRSTKDI